MLREIRSVLREAARQYSRHGGRTLASAVAFATLLSIAPLLFIALSIASITVGDAASRASVFEDLSRWVGREGAETIFALLDRAGSSTRSGLASVIGGIVLAYASTRLFSQMKRALNQMWNVHARSGRGFKAKVVSQVRKRGLSLLLVLLVGLVIIAVVIVKTITAAAAHEFFDDRAARFLFRASEMLITLVTTTAMIAALFKWLPDAKLQWRDALRGALVTAILFAIGTTLISLYIGHKTLDVLYGPGGSLVVVLLWVYYSAQVFFFGAAVTGELARRRGAPIQPDQYGVRIVIDTGEDA